MSELLEKARSFDPSKMEPSKTTWAPLQENVQINEDGHTDVASAVRQCKTTIEDAQDILQKLQTMNPEDSLPSWWTNKLAVVSSSINKMRDYLLVPSVSEEVELDEMKKVSVEFDKRNKSDMMKAKKDLEKLGHTVDVSGSMITITGKKGADIGREIKDVMNFYSGAKRAKALESVEEADEQMNPKDHVARSKNNPDMFCVFDIKGNEVKLFKDRKDAEEYAVKNHDSLMGETKEAVSPAQQAAIAISKKERGEKPKKEEVELDEGKAEYTKKLMKSKSIVDYVKKQQAKNQKYVAKHGNKKIGVFGNEPRFDSGTTWLNIAGAEVKQNKMSDNKRRSFDAEAEYEAIARKLGLHKFEPRFYEEVELDEAVKISHVLVDTANRNEVVSMASSEEQVKQSKNSAERPPMSVKNKNTLKVVALKKPLSQKAADKLMGQSFKESAELDEAKSSTGYELYHKSFSDAMQHSYAFAKKKFGITVDPKEIDRKVATGPKKPSSGKTNSYRLVGTDGKKAIQVQVANLDNKRYELNMYKEEVNLEEETELDTMKAYASGISRILGSQGIEVPINELIDPADVDDDASSKDVALAAKNIILQLKKSVDMNGKKDVEFASGKQKVPAAIAQKALDVHSKMKPQDKMKFQTTIAKSYTGLLNAIKGK